MKTVTLPIPADNSLWSRQSRIIKPDRFLHIFEETPDDVKARVSAEAEKTRTAAEAERGTKGKAEPLDG